MSTCGWGARGWVCGPGSQRGALRASIWPSCLRTSPGPPRASPGRPLVMEGSQSSSPNLARRPALMDHGCHLVAIPGMTGAQRTSPCNRDQSSHHHSDLSGGNTLSALRIFPASLYPTLSGFRSGWPLCHGSPLCYQALTFCHVLHWAQGIKNYHSVAPSFKGLISSDIYN